MLGLISTSLLKFSYLATLVVTKVAMEEICGLLTNGFMKITSLMKLVVITKLEAMIMG